MADNWMRATMSWEDQLKVALRLMMPKGLICD